MLFRGSGHGAPTTMLSLGQCTLENLWQPGNHHDDQFRLRCQRNVQPPLCIAKLPRQNIVGHDTVADFVRDGHDLGWAGIDRADQARLLRVDIVFLMHMIAKPHGGTVNQDRFTGASLAQRRCYIQWFFDSFPTFAALFSVTFNFIRHFVVAKQGRGQIHPPTGVRFHQGFGKARFAGTGATKDQSGFWNHGYGQAYLVLAGCYQGTTGWETVEFAPGDAYTFELKQPKGTRPQMLAGKRILLIIAGGIAAFKSLELIRQLRREGATVTPVLTRAGAEFVTPLSVSALAGEKLYQDLFDLNDEAQMGHIELSRAADLLVVAPGTADLMAKMAHGLANDLAATLLLATDKRVLVAPAMNVRMWEHASTRRNIATLKDDGVLFVGPNVGDMACGEHGPGRMAEPAEIVAAITDALISGPLKGKHILVTSGPTHEPIDPVRYIANRSSGAQGAAIARALSALGAKVTFITGPADVAPPMGVAVARVETAEDMMSAVRSTLPVDGAVFAAAVADWRVISASLGKIKKGDNGLPKLDLAENPDILATVAGMKKGRPELVVGFAAETDDVLENATAKLKRKGCDWIVANNVSPETGIMGGSENAVTVITGEGAEPWERMSKDAVAAKLAAKIAIALAG